MVDSAKDILENKKDFLLGNDILDSKTEKLFFIINKINRIVGFQKCKDEIHSVFFALVHFSDHNLKDLEITLKGHKCKSFISQINHDKKLIDSIIKFQHDYNEGKDNLCRDLLEYIVLWTIEQKKIDLLSVTSLNKD